MKKRLDFSLREVSWQDPYILNAFEKEEAYLLSYEPDRLLSAFRETKGLDPKAERYGGWERTELRGHIFGHWLKAMALTYERTGRPEFKERLTYAFRQAKEAQHAGGYLSAFPEELFDRIEQGGRAWAPWYTMHKIMAGLAEGYRATGDETAADVLIRLAEWVSGRVESWTDEVQSVVLGHEYGGMNDVLYEVYALTRNERFLRAAHRFDEMGLFAQARDLVDFRGLNVLTGMHANTMIPKFLGAIRRYELLGAPARFYLEACQRYWETVVRDHTYITGGHGDLEHFGVTGCLDEGRSNSNNETCNAYNMLKLSRELYQVTGDVKYMDFYENAFINMILASQNPETGMTTYFQSLLTGAFKIFGTPFGKFWCCTGTGMESFSKLGDSIYFHDRENVYVNAYFSTTLHWTDRQFRFTQTADLYGKGEVVFTITQNDNWRPTSICLRLPQWLAEDPVITLNGEPVGAEIRDRYACVSRKWAVGDRLAISLKPRVWCHRLPDSPNCVGFGYGPLVLSALLGQEDMVCDYTGANNDVELTTVHVNVPTEIISESGDPESWLSRLDEHLVREGASLTFRLKGVKEPDLTFVPHYSQYRERFGIYFYIK